MGNLIVVISEANKDIAGLINNWATDKDVIDHYSPFYERVKDQCNSLSFFVAMCIQDLKFSFNNNPNLFVDIALKLEVLHGKYVFDNEDKEHFRVKKRCEFNGIQLSFLANLKKINPLFQVEPYESFDDYGLRFHIDHLNEMGGAIVFLPLEDMAKYADIVVTGFIDANDAEFIESQRDRFEMNDTAIEKLNCTAIGNCAYIAMYCKDQVSADTCMGILNKYYNFLLGKAMGDMNVDKSVN